MIRKAIIVAAGRGRRLESKTDDMPKCMVRVAGRPILDWQLRALSMAGVTDILVVRGYRGDRIATDCTDLRLRFVENTEWERNNILASLLCAAEEMHEGFFFSYADIVYAPSVAARLAAQAAAETPDVALVLDRRWENAYVGRTKHPISEAELARVDDHAAGPSVVRVGKQAVARDQAAGEFIGLARFSQAGAAALKQLWQQALHAGGLDAPFGFAPTLRQAYLSDALNGLADAGKIRLAPVFIEGCWREIDTVQDLASAERAVGEWS